jgi:pyruvate/2-oxoglutarate dehydrogenase complex dihydrolipoamide dehydrogenase (E3) component
VIGGGAGGLVTAASAVGQGAKVALIEKNLLGGDCLNTGCVPSKAFLKCANVAHNARTAEQFGVKVGQVEVDFPFIMERMRKIRASISDNDSAARFSKQLNVDVYLGHAKFFDQTHITVNNKKLNFLKAVVATGARPKVPKINGLDSVTYFTSESIFNLKKQPKSIAILGGGPVAVELGQAFQRLGTKVTFIVRGDQLIGREDFDVSNLLYK